MRITHTEADFVIFGKSTSLIPSTFILIFTHSKLFHMTNAEKTRNIVIDFVTVNLLCYCGYPKQKKDIKERMAYCRREIINFIELVKSPDYFVTITLCDGYEKTSIQQSVDGIIVDVFEVSNKHKATAREYFILKTFFVRLKKEGTRLDFYSRFSSAQISSFIPTK